jgi:hypothetical protein
MGNSGSCNIDQCIRLLDTYESCYNNQVANIEEYHNKNPYAANYLLLNKLTIAVIQNARDALLKIKKLDKIRSERIQRRKEGWAGAFYELYKENPDFFGDVNIKKNVTDQGITEEKLMNLDAYKTNYGFGHKKKRSPKKTTKRQTKR